MLYREAIASTEARFVFQDGKDRLVTIEVSAPFFHEENRNWRCELDLRGMEGAVTAMIAHDSLSALSSALYFLRLSIERYRESGIRVLYPDSDDDFQLDFYFPPGLRKEKKNEPNFSLQSQRTGPGRNSHAPFPLNIARNSKRFTARSPARGSPVTLGKTNAI